MFGAVFRKLWMEGKKVVAGLFKINILSVVFHVSKLTSGRKGYFLSLKLKLW